MKKLMPLLLLALPIQLQAQSEWIAPEGFTVNNRTVYWDDFKGKEDADFAASLAARNLQAEAYVCPAIYFTADSGRVENGRVKFHFRIKCAFQSRAFVRKPNAEKHSNYVLTHEQDHYDVALTYSRILQDQLTNRDYSEKNYNDEIDKVYHDLITKYNQIQKTYDGEVNPEGRDDVPKQHLWDMRIKKCLENNTDQYYTSPEEAVQNVANPGTVVKRIPGEPALQFAVRARPMYTEFTAEMKDKIVETTEWSETPAIIAFYKQRYYAEGEGEDAKDLYRTLAYIFMPTAGEYYKRILIDTFTDNGKQVRLGKVFFANADTDQVKEMVIMASSTQTGGTAYYNRVYDNVFKPMPGQLRRIPEAKTRVESGFEGTKDGKTSHAACRTEDDIREALKKAGFK
jgi:hypothetical protein